MPAYRSSAEAEIRDAVVARIRERRPQARIIHEINVSTYGPNRIDLVAVDRAEIIAVEVKSAKDKLDRLPAQMDAMRGAAHHAIAAIHEKFLVEQLTNQSAAHYERDGKFYLRAEPGGIRGEIWVFPEMRRAMPGANHDSLERWRFPSPQLEISLPSSALDLLWRSELFELCGRLRVAAGRRSTMPDMVAALRWYCTGAELTRGICAMLRGRRCVEADPEIIERVAA
jgi:hypothetical protein